MVSGPSPTAHANEVLAVDAESACPTTTPGPCVRVAAYTPFLRDHAVELRFSSHLSASEYRVLGSAGARVAKARLIAASAVRVARKARPIDTPLMVHRLLSLVGPRSAGTRSGLRLRRCAVPRLDLQSEPVLSHAQA